MGTIEWVCFERSEQSHFPSHRICLNPLLTFKNTLPFPIMVMLDKEASIPQEIAPGHHMEIDGVELRDEKENPFFFVIRVMGTIEWVCFERSEQSHFPSHRICLNPLLTFKNTLPFPIMVMILDYMGTTYSCKHPVPKSPDLVSTWEFRDENGSQPPLHLGVYGVRLNGGIQLDLFASFWVVNQTGLPLYYKVNALWKRPWFDEEEEEPVG
ncbi:unnamed protein product [Cyprideis torosa]|uniref:Uncharacterized protein n=1 Tax=Cyprideis torosa TaxID=163714 RepID=A0A7R8WQ94_9CRUS|nr:unnamed protein product [Cyprideis torosa]CAG0902212.1 unnamed protein product [Cyprideis torosa]